MPPNPEMTIQDAASMPLVIPTNGTEHAKTDDKSLALSSANVGNDSIVVAKHDASSTNHSDTKLEPPAQSIDRNHRSDEYVSLLEKRLDAMETKLSGFNKSQSKDVKKDDGARVDEEASPYPEELQKIEIMRVSAGRWRIVKKEAGLDPKLSVLIVSSKKDIKARRTRHKNPNTAEELSIQDNDRSDPGMRTTVEIPYRLAINSAYLLDALGQCTGTTFPEDHNVLVRPFKYLVAYEAEIRDFLKEVEAICDQAEANLEQLPQDDSFQKLVEDVPVSADAPKGEPVEIVSGDAKDAKDARPSTKDNADNDRISKMEDEVRQARRNRDELRCLVDFMDQDMRDIFNVKKEVSSHTLKEIAFEDLWQVYKPGSVLYTSSQRESRSRRQAYRVIHVTGGRVCFDNGKKASFDAVTGRKWDEESENDEKCKEAVKAAVREVTTFIIDCYFLDFDGYRIGPTPKRFAITPYNGQRSVLSFPVYPSEFDPMNEELEITLTQRGKRFMDLVLGAHKKYSGLTLREQNQISGSAGAYSNWTIVDAEVKGEVIIDQAGGVEYFKEKIYRWGLNFGGSVLLQPTLGDKREVFDPLSKKKDQWLTDVFDDSLFEEDRRSEFLRSTDELWLPALDGSNLKDNVLKLLPPRVYGYAMLHHKWFPMDINLVEDIDEEELKTTRSAFEDLVLPEGHRTLLQALIENQVRAPKQNYGKPEDVEDDFSMDLVKGKGKGLIILLHGVPGVGKTSTAECVAAQLKRPLLPITCGDIGDTAREAEATLENFCELAHRWRCVLLLDEADIFLAKREKGDIARNSLVSVFLRVLEYYSGVIILTTNRVGEFDEAFRSRIHISLYYPKLDRLSTNKIWERNILRVKNSGLDIDMEEDKIRNFYERHWQGNKQHPSRRWNGRQIKNAFQTALALANWDFHDSQKAAALDRPFLRAAHFNRVAETSGHFDDYISDIHGMQEQDTYGMLAAREELRKDTHPGISPKTRMQQGQNRRNIPARRAGNYRGSFDSYDDQSHDNDDLEHRPKRTPTAFYGSHSHRAVESQDFDDEPVLENGDGGSRNRRTGKTRLGEGAASRSRDHHDDQDARDDDLDDDDVQQLELQLKLAKLKKRKGPTYREGLETQPGKAGGENW